MVTHEFKDKRCWQLWQAAAPKGERHLAAFAWRESPIGLERAWAKACNGRSDDDRDLLLAQCLRAGEKQAAYRRSRLSAGERLPRPRGIAVWVNAGAWAEELEVASSSGEPVKASSCQHCEAPMVHAHFGTCARHTPIPEGHSAWLETRMRSMDADVKRWKMANQQPGESDTEAYKRLARIHWRKWRERCTK